MSRQQWRVAARWGGWLCVLVIVYFSLTSSGIRARAGVAPVGAVDHTLAYAGAMFLLGVGHVARRERMLCLGFLLALALVLEVAQVAIPGRTAQPIDWVGSAAGVALGYAAAVAAFAMESIFTRRRFEENV
jgi:VanZ family protein